MNTKCYVIGSAVVFLFIFSFEFVLHGMVLYDTYANLPNLMRPPAVANGLLHWMIVAEFIAIVGVFVTAADLRHALHHQIEDRVFHITRVSRIINDRRQLFDEADLLFHFAEQQNARIGGEAAALEIKHDRGVLYIH